MQEAIQELLQAKPDLVLIPGDLTKDGELVCHNSVHTYLEQLIQAGIKVRVITGNHDIFNPHSYQYDGATQTRVANIGPAQFRSIYYDCGYSDALYTDPNSLSYVSEPLPNLWLIAIDCCKYDSVIDTIYTAGAIRPGTMKWVLDRMAEAALKGKTVFGMMHHGLVEQFSEKHVTFPGGLYVQTDKRGIRQLDVPIWNIKLGWNKKVAIRIYRVGGRNAIKCVEKRSGHYG
ncbi:MAG: metallophosphoesterase [Bacteroidota bacterium]